MKKITAILLSVLMLASVLCIGVSAETTSVNVKLTGAAQATKGETYTVTLSVDDATVGGLQGTIIYEAAAFEFIGIEITEKMADANRITETDAGNLINSDTTNGNIKFVVLCDGTSKQLVKLNFKTKEDNTNVTTANFNLSGVKVSNGDGTATVTNIATNITPPNIYATAINVEGASVKTNGDADIRFETTVKNADITEVGVIMIPKKFLADGQEITYSEDAIYSGKKAAIAKLTVDNDIAENEKVYANLNLSAQNESRIKMEIAARAYVKLSNGTIVYSDNADSTKNINGGTSSRCCIDVVKAIAAEEEYTNDILNKANSEWTKEEYETVVKGIRDKIDAE